MVQTWDRLLGQIAVFPLVGCLQCLTVVLRSCRIAILVLRSLPPAPELCNHANQASSSDSLGQDVLAAEGIAAVAS